MVDTPESTSFRIAPVELTVSGDHMYDWQVSGPGWSAKGRARSFRRARRQVHKMLRQQKIDGKLLAQSTSISKEEP